MKLILFLTAATILVANMQPGKAAPSDKAAPSGKAAPPGKAAPSGTYSKGRSNIFQSESSVFQKVLGPQKMTERGQDAVKLAKMAFRQCLPEHWWYLTWENIENCIVRFFVMLPNSLF